MKNYSKLTATVEETNEMLLLQEDDKYFDDAFNRLAELLGKDFDNVNDNLMDGITEWGGTEWTHRVYSLGEVTSTITFKFTPTKEYVIEDAADFLLITSGGLPEEAAKRYSECINLHANDYIRNKYEGFTEEEYKELIEETEKVYNKY